MAHSFNSMALIYIPSAAGQYWQGLIELGGAHAGLQA